MQRAEPLQDPANLGMIPGVVGPGPKIELTTTATEVRHCEGHALLARKVGESLRVVAPGGALQSMEENHERRLGWSRLLNWPYCGGRTMGLEPVNVNEVGIGRGPALAPVQG